MRETLALLQSRAPMSSETTLHEVARSTLDPWQSLVEIRIDASDDAVSAHVAQAISDVLEECVANAFRHGRASGIDCALEMQEQHVRVRVQDNGCGSTVPEGDPGLGSRILDRSGTWTRTYGPAGTTVVALIPLALTLGG